MRVDGDGGDAGDFREVAEMAAKPRLVDREIRIERQQSGGDDPVRHEIAETRHRVLLWQHIQHSARRREVPLGAWV